MDNRTREIGLFAHGPQRPGWWSGTMECGICHDRENITIELRPGERDPSVACQCGRCWAMACHPTKERK